MSLRCHFLCLMLLVLCGCSGKPQPAPLNTPPPSATSTPMSLADKRPTGLTFCLSPAEGSNSQGSQAPQAVTTALTSAQVGKLLRRLPPLQKAASDIKDFAMRENSLPPPKTAQSIPVAFPPAPRSTAPPAQAGGALRVTTCAPKGEIEMAPHLTVTFNQPMVALSTLEQIEEKSLPVRISPQPEGKWRWLGTDTLMFVPKIRFPMATEFKVEVPAGTASALGAKLEKAESFSFSTPALKLHNSWPSGSGLPLNLMLFLSFDQDIDPAALFPSITLTSQGRKCPIQLATAEEVALNAQMRGLSEGAGKGRSLVIKPIQGLAPGHSYNVTVASGAPSKEGPRKTGTDQSFQFSTYDPLKVTHHTEKAQPREGWFVSFNNPLNPKAFDVDKVRVSPDLPDLKLTASASGIYIQGRSKGKTNYQVSLPAEISDGFGQLLGHQENFTVHVEAARPTFTGPPSSFMTLDPQGPRQVTCQVSGYPRVKVSLWKVTPEDYPGYLAHMQSQTLPLPGTVVSEQEIPTGAKEDEMVDLNIDLSAALPKDLGHVVVRLEPLPVPPQNQHHSRYMGWIQSTQLGMDAMSDGQKMWVWVNHLATGESAPGVQVKMLGRDQASTDTHGLASIKGLDGQVLVASLGADSAMMTREHSYWSATAVAPTQKLWYVTDDRHLYRPGEKVCIKGWLRRASYGPDGDILGSQAKVLRYRLLDARGNEIGKSQCRIGRLGSFQFSFVLPKTVNLGHVNISMDTDSGENSNHAFQVQEFRRPEFEVSAEASPSSSQIGSHASVTATASYFSGGPLPHATVDWSVSASPTSYAPPHWPGYTFGTWTPWWNCRRWWNDDMPVLERRPAAGRRYDVGEAAPVRSSAASRAQTLQTRTDGKGKSSLRVDFQSADPPQPHSVLAQATVRDVNRQAWTTSTSLMVHPSSLYVGLKTQRTFVEKDRPLEVEVVVTDIDGKAVSGSKIRIHSYRSEWDWKTNKLTRAQESTQELTSGQHALKVKIPASEGGTYLVEALVQDQENRRNRSELTMWVAGGKQPPSLRVEQEALTVIPAKAEFDCSEPAELLVQAPFAPAELMVTTRRNGLAHIQRLSAPSGSTTVKIPLKECYIPGVTVQIDAVGSQPRPPHPDKTMRPAYATANLNLTISKAPRKLSVEVKAGAPSLAPGANTSVDVQLVDYRGKPVQGDVAVMMVDESVLALSGQLFADPLESFCAVRPPDVRDFHSRQFVLLNRPEPPAPDSAGPVKAPGASALTGSTRAEARGDAGGCEDFFADSATTNKSAPGAAPAPPPLTLRTNFTPLALYAPSVSTDARGRARIPVKLPDNLTRYRIIALAAAGDKQFGKGESTVTARQPLMIRPSLPRFLNFGDRCVLPVVLQNQTDRAMQVSLVCRASNALLGSKQHSAGYALKLKAHDRVEVRFPCTTDKAGTARFQFAAVSGSAGDAAEVSLPVWTPATTEAFATYGVVDEGAMVQPVEKPAGILPQFGGLTVTTSSTALAELTDAFLYLTSYPFDCAEQVSSRMLAAAAVRDVLQAFKAPGMPSAGELESAMQRDLLRLKALQADDGGFDYWRRDLASVPYLTVHVAHALVRVKAKGYKVDEGMLARTLGYLNSIETHFPDFYSPYSRRSIRAYALYVLDQAGQSNFSKAAALYREDKDVSVETMAWLLPTFHKNPAGKPLADEITSYFENHLTQTASTAQFVANHHDQDYLLLYSDRRDDAVVLESLMLTRPKHPIIPKLVRGLLDHRSAGRWENTQENCWVLLALDAYFQQFESVTPDFVARVWLGQQFAGEQKFQGRNKNQNVMHIPFSYLKEASQPLTLAKQGAGRLYYRLGMQYAPANFKMEAADYGFAVERRYEAVKDNRDVSRDAEGRLHVKAGSEVKVTVTMRAPSRRYHVALVDPLPAGFEALNPALQGEGDLARTALNRKSPPRYSWEWGGYWFMHQNLRDERVECFTQLLWEGVYSYSYVARATTPGTFVVPPAKAEEMYHPETFGRSRSEIVCVE